MTESETAERNRKGWNAISTSYQAERQISESDVHYGPLAAGERELGLLGEVAGLRILEVGCGGGQNSIALARWGATCVGIDPSVQQLAHARRLADEHGLPVKFANGIAEDLGDFRDESFDLVLSSYAFDYVADLGRAFREAWRVLEPGGLFVFCQSHPWFQAVGWYLAGDPDAPEIGNYAAWPAVEEWEWEFGDGTSSLMRGYLRSLAQIVNELAEAGFWLERMVEQATEDVAAASPDQLGRLPYVHPFDPDSREYSIMRRLPFTLIIRARKATAIRNSRSRES
jgi:ubiquinone/menaquinone biosynthesis C-methylase UbiE